jgi:hypothetical protein
LPAAVLPLAALGALAANFSAKNPSQARPDLGEFFLRQAAAFWRLSGGRPFLVLREHRPPEGPQRCWITGERNDAGAAQVWIGNLKRQQCDHEKLLLFQEKLTLVPLQRQDD